MKHGYTLLVPSLAFALLIGCQFQTLQELPTAGTAKTSGHDGVMMIFVPSGRFLMGSLADTADTQPDEVPQHVVYLNGFWIDQVEITNARYNRCVEASACLPIVTPRPDMAEHPYHPVQGVAWPQAIAYCEWVGRRLPTEAEWEKAARGTDGQRFPWGDNISDGQKINIDFRVGDINDVGTNPDDASPYGVLDMAGNVSEWVADWYQDDYYLESPDLDPQGPERGTVRGQRGGAWNTAPKAARAANRFWAFPDRNDFTGFRCAKSS